MLRKIGKRVNTNNKLAKDRTHLANERTFLASIRTALALVVTGGFFLKFFPMYFSVVIFIAFMVIGLVFFGFGIWNFVGFEKKINKDE